jgi:hypothetical protein
VRFDGSGPAERPLVAVTRPLVGLNVPLATGSGTFTLSLFFADALATNGAGVVQISRSARRRRVVVGGRQLGAGQRPAASSCGYADPSRRIVRARQGRGLRRCSASHTDRAARAHASVVTTVVIAGVPRSEWETRRVRDAMIPLDRVQLLTEDETAVDALAALSSPTPNRGLVVQNGHLAGFLSITDLTRALEVRAQRGRPRPDPTQQPSRRPVRRD